MSLPLLHGTTNHNGRITRAQRIGQKGKSYQDGTNTKEQDKQKWRRKQITREIDRGEVPK